MEHSGEQVEALRQAVSSRDGTACHNTSPWVGWDVGVTDDDDCHIRHITCFACKTLSCQNLVTQPSASPLRCRCSLACSPQAGKLNDDTAQALCVAFKSNLTRFSCSSAWQPGSARKAVGRCCRRQSRQSRPTALCVSTPATGGGALAPSFWHLPGTGDCSRSTVCFKVAQSTARDAINDLENYDKHSFAINKACRKSALCRAQKGNRACPEHCAHRQAELALAGSAGGITAPFALRDYQQEALDKVSGGSNWVVSAPTNAGKTAIFVEACK